MTHNLEISSGLSFLCGNGGVIKTISEDGNTELQAQTGADDEFAYYDDLHLNAYNDMVVNVDGDYHVEGSVKHVTGDSVMHFNLSSLEPNGKVDVKLSGLSPESWYRLRFGGNLAACEGGRAHGKTNEEGLLTFNKVEIPNE
jgi:hypothetical protein